MIRTLVLCDHVGVSEISAGGNYDQTLSINQTSPDQNLRLQIRNITHQILSELSPLSQDLLEIAAYVYYADCSIRRGTEKDAYADGWKRRFEFVIPVSNPSNWNNPDVKNLLEETLDFLTGDEYSFEFVSPRPKQAQPYINFPDVLPPFPDSDVACLFSGGLDSLIGSLFILKERNERPLLVSHLSRPGIAGLQKDLVELLRKRNPEWEFPRLSAWINRMGNQAVEETQRARSFLYLSIATAVVAQLGMKKIYMCENGIISVNIPTLGQSVGTLLTRSTHPKFLRLFEQLVHKLFTDISIENPFIFQTKTEMLKQLERWNQSELIPATVSCSYPQRKSKMQRHCGTCSQCVNRRFSIIAAGLEEHDRPEFYEKDIFLDQLEAGKESTYAVGYVGTALEISKMDDIEFFSNYPEIDEVLNNTGMNIEEEGRKLYELFQRHANEVMEVANAKFGSHQRELLAGELPDNCLVSMLGSRDHLNQRDLNIQEYVARFQAIEPGREQFREFEDLCTEILRELYCPPLGEPDIQSRTADGLDIRDALFPNHSGNGIWQRIRRLVPHNFVVFEFKNWGEKVDQTAIEQGKKYVSRKSIGKLCIIVSRKGISKSGTEAQKVAYRDDSDAVVLAITDDHLIQMLTIKQRNREPAELIERLIEKFLIEY